MGGSRLGQRELRRAMLKQRLVAVHKRDHADVAKAVATDGTSAGDLGRARPRCHPLLHPEGVPCDRCPSLA